MEDYNKNDYALVTPRGKTILIRVAAILTILGCLWVALSYYVSTSARDTYSEAAANSATPAPTYPIPANVLPIIQRLGIDQTTASHVQITTPVDNTSCKGGSLAEPGACSRGNTITLPMTAFSKTTVQQNALFAHEYLHTVWSQLSEADKDALTPYIEQAYQNARPYLDTRISKYNFTIGGNALRLNELHSYVGTEIADSLIPQPLLDHYKKYLPNRDALPSLYPYPVVITPKPVCIQNYTYSYLTDSMGHLMLNKVPSGTTCY